MNTKTPKQLKGTAWSLLSIVIMLALALTITGSPAQAAGESVASESPLLASGDLDTTFSGDGKLQTIFYAGMDAIAWDVGVQADGKIVAIGEVRPAGSTGRTVGVMRYTALGAPDTTFSGDGKKLIDLGGENDIGEGLAIQASTGKIIVAGYTCPSGGPCDSAVLRINPAGGLDSTFSLDGKRIDDFGGNGNASHAVAVYPDGRILVGGFACRVSGFCDFALIRYKTGGGLDTTFSADGKATIPFGSARNAEVTALAIQPDGKIVASGSSCDSNWVNCDFALARLNANGTLDPTFSGDGKRVTSLGADDVSEDMIIQPNGKIVQVGSRYLEPTVLFALARYNTNGSLDTTFSGDGKQLTNFTNDANPEWIKAVIARPDGKIVVCGGAGDDIAVARFMSSGMLDTTFSSDGKATVDFGETDICYGMAVQPDGKYVLAGRSFTGTHHIWSVARIWP